MLRRKKPLSAKTPLKRGTWKKSFGTTSTNRPRKPLRKFSKRRERDEREYAKLRARFLEQNAFCAVYPSERATQVHHRFGRYGGYYLDTSTWLAVSAKGHEFIHANPAIAREKGWLVYGKDGK